MHVAAHLRRSSLQMPSCSSRVQKSAASRALKPCPAKDPIRIFVTHAFAGHPDYHRVFEYLESAANFFYRELQRAGPSPAAGGKEALKEEYRTQMKQAEVVIVLSSLYRENEYWVTYQMDAAQASNFRSSRSCRSAATRNPRTRSSNAPQRSMEWNEREIARRRPPAGAPRDTARWDSSSSKCEGTVDALDASAR